MSHTVVWDGYSASFAQILDDLEAGKISKLVFKDEEEDSPIFYTPQPPTPTCTHCESPALPIVFFETDTLCEDHLWIQFEIPEIESITVHYN